LPFVAVDNTRLYYRLEGIAGRPVLVLSHSLGCDHGMWAPQMPDLLTHFQVLRFDTRGHGVSDATAGEYSIERLGRDALGLLDTLKISKFAFCGLSMGGAIGQWLALHAADRMTHLVLANTSSRFASHLLEARRQAVLKDGIGAVIDGAIQRFFLPDTIALPDANAARGASAASVRSVFLGTDPNGYAGCCAAIRDVNFTDSLPKIKVPTLVIAGDRDVSTPWAEHGEILFGNIPGARATRLPAAHLSNIDCPRAFTTALLNFVLSEETSTDSLQTGERTRRAALGDEHVNRSKANATEFTADFLDLITRYAWGSIWSRPGLDRRTRYLLTLTATAALARWEEFRLHVRAGLAHDLEPCDLKEALLQAAIYAGVPAANTGFHIASEELEKAREKNEAATQSK